MSSRIEEGCIARVINGALGSESPNIGKIITVGRFLGRVKNFLHSDLWEVDKPMETTKGVQVYFISERYLQRIDDGNLTEEELAEEEELVLIGENE